MVVDSLLLVLLVDKAVHITLVQVGLFWLLAQLVHFILPFVLKEERIRDRSLSLAFERWQIL